MSETEYVEDLNTLVMEAGADFASSNADYAQIAEPTLDQFVSYVEQQLGFEYEVRERFETLDPPDSLDDVNQIMVDTLHQLIAAAEDLVDTAQTASSLQELEQSEEFAEYQGINADADSMCLDVQAELNDLSSKPIVEGPWLADLNRTVRAFLDCDDVATG